MNRIMQILSIVTMVMVGFLTGPMSSAQAQTTCLTPLLVPSQDATITGGAKATQNFGSTTTLVVGNGGGSPNRALIKFDVSAVPSTATITTATLSLRRMVGTSGTIALNVITSAWSETTVTWSSFVGAIGGSAGSLSLPAGNPVTVSVNIVGTVQGWVSGAVLNHGLVFSPGTAAGGFLSRESAIKPTLDICFTLPSCSDGTQNQGESGVDCSGPCAACPTCSDLIQNGAETDVDCGGGTCTACDEGGVCSVDADCLTGSCSAGFCAWPVCDNVGDCDACTQCAIVGVASVDYDALLASIPGQDYAACLGACLDTACWQVCEAANPAGAAVYNAAVTSIYCVGCPMDCDMANNQFWDCSSGGPAY